MELKIKLVTQSSEDSQQGLLFQELSSEITNLIGKKLVNQNCLVKSLDITVGQKKNKKKK